jgi:Arc/MetJ-type ribon-helix-helix transcriptional regulator
MKTLTVRLPESLVAEIEAEASQHNQTKSDVVRERLEHYGAQPKRAVRRPTMLELAGDLIGSVTGDGLPRDLSANKKKYLREWGYGKKRPRR